MSIASRPYRDEQDLRDMQRLIEEIWRIQGPRVPCTPGDLAWWMYGPSGQDTAGIRLWEEPDGGLVAWAWLAAPAAMDVLIHPERRDSSIEEEMLAWQAERAAVRAHADPSGQMTVWVMDGDPLADVLLANGFQPGPTELVHTIRRLDEISPTQPELPGGFTVRAAGREEDLERRVEVHRAAFAPSRMTTEIYRGLMGSETYRRAAVDLVVEGPTGEFGAFCIAWVLPEIGAGELEPVGTHPDYRRKGLATAVCQAALLAMHGRGVSLAIVYHDAAAEASRRLYQETLGFEELARHHKYEAPFPGGRGP